jgi:ribosomal protein S18 acetylase RimI-like enzyme
MREVWRIEALDLSDRPTAARVVEIQRAAYAVEAALIGFDGIPARSATLENLLATAMRFEWSGIRSAGTVVAAMAVSMESGMCDIDRLVVDPGWFRRGLARALLSALPTGVAVTVSTGSANGPGIALYEGMGFVAESVETVAPGLEVTHLRRPAHET